MKNFHSLRQNLAEANVDITTHSTKRLKSILDDPNHPHHSAAKAEMDRRGMKEGISEERPTDSEVANAGRSRPANMKVNKTAALAAKASSEAKPKSQVSLKKAPWDESVDEGAMKRMSQAQSNKADRTSSHDKTKPGLDTYTKKPKKEVDEAVGTSAKHAGKSGMFGGKYTSKDHMTGMKNFSQIRKKRADQRDAEHQKQDPKMAKMGYAKHMLDTDKADAKAKKRGIDPTGKYDKYKKANNIKDSVQMDEVLDTPKAMDSYKNKAKASKEKAASSAVAKIMRNKDKDHRAHPAADLKTIAKRTAGEKMADRNAARKTRKALMNNEEKDTHVTKDGRTAKKGLWYNIHQKRKRGEKPNPKGHPDRPSMDDMKKSQK